MSENSEPQEITVLGGQEVVLPLAGSLSIDFQGSGVVSFASFSIGTGGSLTVHNPGSAAISATLSPAGGSGQIMLTGVLTGGGQAGSLVVDIASLQSGPQLVTLSGNQAPSIKAPAVKHARISEWWRLSDFIQVTDADSAGFVRFDLRELGSNTAANSGFFFANGSAQAQGASVTVEESTLFNTWIRGGLAAGTDRYELRVFDGAGWSEWTEFDVTTRAVNHVPVVTPTASTQGIVAGNVVAAAALFAYGDADGDAAIKYQFRDDGAAGGQFRVDGAVQASGQVIEVEAGELGSVAYAAGDAPGSERLSARAFDGEAWSDWKSWNMQTLRATNQASVVDAPAAKNAVQNEWRRLSDFIQVTDADGDPIVRMEVRDNAAAAGSAYISWNGTTYAQGATAQIEGSALSGVWLRGGANLGTDNIEIRVFDGYEWGAWEAFDFRTRLPNRAPVITPTSATQAVVVGNSVAANTLFSLTDADGDAATMYEFYDAGVNGGRFMANGTPKAGSTTFSLNAGDLATLTYQAGAATGGEVLRMRAYDGEAWSPWVSWTEQTLRATNQVSTVDAPAFKQVLGNEWIRLSQIVSVSDADGDPIVRMEVRDDTASAGSAYIWWNGTTYAQGATAQIESSDLSGVWLRGGTIRVTDNIEIRVFDGYEWGAWESFDLRTRANRAPTLALDNASQSVAIGGSVPASALFQYSDAEGDPAARYAFRDGGTGGGFFTVDGFQQTAGQWIEIDAAELARVAYHAGSERGSETVSARAFDGELWSDDRSWEMQTLPNISAGSVSAAQFEHIDLAPLITLNHGGRPITALLLVDLLGANASAYTGVLQRRPGAQLDQAFGQDTAGITIIPLADLGNYEFLTGSSAGVRTLDVYAYDGESYLDPVTITVSTGAAVADSAGNTLSAAADVRLENERISHWTDWVGASDPDDFYRFTISEAGQVSVGVNMLFGNADLQLLDSAGAVISSSSNPGTLSESAGFNAPAAGTYYVRVSSAGEPTGYMLLLNLGGDFNESPRIVAGDATLPTGQSVQVSELFGVTDRENNAATRYQFFDNDGGAAGGYFVLSGVSRPALQTFEIAAAQLNQLAYTAGAADTAETIWLRAFDGTTWGSWEDVFIETRADGEFNRSPIVSWAPNNFGFLETPQGESVRVQPVFTTLDPDGDPIVCYAFADSSDAIDTGYFTVHGVRQTSGEPFIVDAADLDAVRYVGGRNDLTITGTLEAFSVAAFDGHVWSPWLTGDATTSAMPDADRGNDSLATAEQSLSLFNVINFQWPVAQGWVGQTDPVDYFRFTLPQNLNLTFSVVLSDPFSSAPIYASVQILDGAGTILASIDAGHDANLDLTAGSYYGRVSNVGEEHSSWKVFADVRRYQLVNQLPVLTPQVDSVKTGQVSSAGALFSRFDPDGDTLARLQFLDGGASPSSGYFRPSGGQPYAAGEAFEVSLSDFGHLEYVGGSTPGSETVQVRAYDGYGWSDWVGWSIESETNVAPAVATHDGSVLPGTSVLLTNFISTSDANGDPMVSYEFQWSGTGDGFFFKHAPVSGSSIVVGAGDLRSRFGSDDTFAFHAGADGTDEMVSVRAFDGFDWSEWSSFAIHSAGSPPPDTAGAELGSLGLRPLTLTDNQLSLSESIGAPGDAVDGYSLTLAAPGSLHLELATENDLLGRFFVFGPSAAGKDFDSTKQTALDLAAPAGTYTIKVDSFLGASNYNLSIAFSPS